MPADRLRVRARPRLDQARLVMGFSGWMDGGEVSTGTVGALAAKLDAQPLAEIDSEGMYLLSFPGSMEVAALFRPHVKIEDGLVTRQEFPANRFFCSAPHNLILFLGKEPNLHWGEYAECIFSLARQFGVVAMYFIGSVAGLVPHTRQPRLFSSVSDEALKPAIQQYGVRFSNYEGPGSISTYLARLAAERGVPLINLVAEIPAYVQGRNHRCIEATVRQLGAILNLPLNLDDLRVLGDRLEEKLDQVVQEHPELQERIRKLEEDYDNEVFDTQMGDLKDWLERRGIRLD